MAIPKAPVCTQECATTIICVSLTVHENEYLFPLGIEGVRMVASRTCERGPLRGPVGKVRVRLVVGAKVESRVEGGRVGHGEGGAEGVAALREAARLPGRGRLSHRVVNDHLLQHAINVVLRIYLSRLISVCARGSLPSAATLSARGCPCSRAGSRLRRRARSSALLLWNQHHSRQHPQGVY